MRKLLLLVPFLLMSGCMSTFHTQPYVMYADPQHPQSDTSVLTTSGMNGSALGQIVAVDGIKTSCWKVGEDPDYGIYVGLQGVNQKRYRASFK